MISGMFELKLQFRTTTTNIQNASAIKMKTKNMGNTFPYRLLTELE